ncbi:ATP synthase-coupling factor 6, mitochondrial-like [Anneissia japonica]|uniref:ATP synthase-coupling factor 6, mitochondrial-like n=1 Tax=Anneissia japonica TaxID=1529436 RepID=UPI001425664D|nr:ATP synthase-coupling factor 6, mitochondrial-like [Anneissia japonica]
MQASVRNLCPMIRWSVNISRTITSSSVALNKANESNLDPIQKLYLEKVRAYAKKSKASSGAMVDPNPQILKEIEQETIKLNRLYGGGDMTQFPEFQFNEINFEEK